MPLTASTAKNLLFSTEYPPDKIVGIWEGEFTANASGSAGSPERTHEAIDHGFGQTVFLQLAYSRDGGTTWQDQHQSIPDLSTPSSPVFQTVDVGCYSTSTQVVVVAANFTTSNRTITYRLVAFWKD